MSFSYSNTPTEWSQPRLRNQVEEEEEDTGEADDTEETSEVPKHGKIHFQGNLKINVCGVSLLYLLRKIEYSRSPLSMVLLFAVAVTHS